MNDFQTRVWDALTASSIIAVDAVAHTGGDNERAPGDPVIRLSMRRTGVNVDGFLKNDIWDIEMDWQGAIDEGEAEFALDSRRVINALRECAPVQRLVRLPDGYRQIIEVVDPEAY